MNENEKDIAFSQAIKAGKRIYYIDVKKNRKDEMYISITESKKIISGEGENTSISFEKHKIFLYQEDFSKFISGLSKAISYIHENQPNGEDYTTDEENVILESNETDITPLDGELNIQIDFE